jgi:phage anti-repressor protein
LPSTIRDKSHKKDNYLAQIERGEDEARAMSPCQRTRSDPSLEPIMCAAILLVNAPTMPVISRLQIAGQNTNAVNARDLHCFMTVKSEFNNWIKNRIDEFGFLEHKDFEVFVNYYENSKGGRPTKEYALTMDMAKELCMVERNEKGRQARAYFIECEKKAMAIKTPKNPFLEMDQEQMMEFALVQVRENKAKEQIINNQQNVISEKTEENQVLEGMIIETEAVIERIVTQTPGSMPIYEAAKHLQMNASALPKWLNRLGWTYHNPLGHNVASAHVIKSGWLEHKIQVYESSSNTYALVCVTPSGLVELARLAKIQGQL